METIKEPIHPRRLEKNANITFNRRYSRRRFHMVGEERLLFFLLRGWS